MKDKSGDVKKKEPASRRFWIFYGIVAIGGAAILYLLGWVI